MHFLLAIPYWLITDSPRIGDYMCGASSRRTDLAPFDFEVAGGSTSQNSSRALDVLGVYRKYNPHRSLAQACVVSYDVDYLI